MKIACLGWGSLIWRPDNLLIRREWFADGPLLPIEFVRQSNDGRLTLVITNSAKPVRTLWALMATDDLNIAKQSLKIREGIPNSKFETSISSITTIEETDDLIKLVIQEWAKSLKLDAVIWTSLPSKFRDTDGEEPTLEEAVTYLSTLDINRQATAEEYIRRAPKQIDTEFRRKFEGVFGWKFREE
jgi:hypothetical protein